MTWKAKLKQNAAKVWILMKEGIKRIIGSVKKMAKTVSRGINRLGAAIVVHRETMGYYAVLTLVLVALGAAANDYRSKRTLQRLFETLPTQEPGISVQTKADPTLPPEQPAKYILPIQGTVVNGFSDSELNWSTTLQLWQTHPANDIAASVGEAVVAAADGIIMEVYNDALYGNCIVIDHGDGEVIRYASLNTINLVEPEQKVRQGQIISAVGSCNAEAELGAHVHLECFVNGQATDLMLLTNEQS